MSNREEFPELTPEARAAYGAAIDAIRNPNATISPNDNRRYLRAFLREAMRQAMNGDGFVLVNLAHIAANLHSPPSPPPTLADARKADLHTPAGRDVVRDFLANLAMETQP